MRSLVAATRRADPVRSCLATFFSIVCLTGCTSAPTAETTPPDPLAEWTKRARPESENDRAFGLSDKALETERRLGFH